MVSLDKKAVTYVKFYKGLETVNMRASILRTAKLIQHSQLLRKLIYTLFAYDLTPTNYMIT